MGMRTSLLAERAWYRYQYDGSGNQGHRHVPDFNQNQLYKDLCNAALWKNNTICAGYYLRKRVEIFYQDGTYWLEPPPMPVVAAQTILPGRDSTLNRASSSSRSSAPSGQGNEERTKGPR